MSRDWSRAELDAASKAMKAAGQPSFEEFCDDVAEQEARARIERFAERQFKGKYPCPRCGAWAMNADPHRNALSRRAKVYVCDLCGQFEALEAFMGEEQSLTSWDIARRENWPL